MFIYPKIVSPAKVGDSHSSGKLVYLCLPIELNERHVVCWSFNICIKFVIRFYDRRDGEDAMHAMDGRMMDGRELRVQLARYGRPDDPPSRRHGGRSSRRRR